MSKKSKIILSIIGIILIVAIVVLIYMNMNNRKISSQIEVTNYETEGKNSSEKLQNMTLSTSSYTPENIDISENKINEDNGSSFDFTDLENRNLENVKIEVLEETVTANGLTVIITDNNDISYTWDPDFYKVEQKINDTWQEILPKKPLDSELIGYTRDENNQFKFEINWTRYYGTLENGIYRIVEIPFNYPGEKTYNCAYSNEFEIK